MSFYEFDIEETLYLYTSLSLWLDDALIGAHDVSLGIGSFHLEKNAFLVFVEDVNGAERAPLAISSVSEDDLNRVDDHKLTPLFITSFDHSVRYNKII